MIEPRHDAFEVADAVPVRVLERTRIDLIDNAALPPAMSVGHANLLSDQDAIRAAAIAVNSRKYEGWELGTLRRPHERDEVRERLYGLLGPGMGFAHRATPATTFRGGSTQYTQ